MPARTSPADLRNLLLRGLFRNRITRTGMLSVLLMVAAVVLLQQVTTMTRLSDQQRVDLYLGSAEVTASAPAQRCPPSSCPTAQDMASAAEDHGASTVIPLSTAISVPLDGAVSREGPAAGVTLLEGDWTGSTHPEEYTLKEGTWPQRSGEVAFTPEAAQEAGAGIGDSLMLAHGYEARVVGIIATRNQPGDALALSAPGTIDGIYQHLEAAGNRYSSPDVMASLRWSGGDDEQIIAAMAEVIAAEGVMSRDMAEESIQRSAARRDSVGSPPYWWFVEIPWNWGLIPVVVLLSTAGLVLVLSTLGLERRVVRQVTRLGIPESLIRIRFLTIRWWLGLLGLVGGTLLGLGISWCLRPVTRRVQGHEIAAFEYSWFFALAISVLLLLPPLLFLLLSLCRMLWNRSSTSRLRAGILQVAFGLGVFLLVWFLASTIVTDLQMARGSQDHLSRLLIIGSLLDCALCAVLLPGGISRLPVRGAVGLIACRWIRQHRTVAGLTVFLAMGSVTVPLITAVTLSTGLYYGSLKIISEVPEGYVAIGSNVYSDEEIPPELLAEIEEYAGLGRRIPVWRTDICTESEFGCLVAVDGQEDLEELLGRSLTEQESRAWSSGEILSGHMEELPAQDGLYLMSSEEKSIGVRPFHRMENLPEGLLQESGAGVLPLSIARSWGAQVDAPYHFYAGVSQDQSDRVAAAPTALGFESHWVKVHEKPDDLGLDPHVSGLAVMMGGTTVIILAGLTRLTVRSHAGYLSALRSLGLSTSLLRRALRRQQALLIILPLLLSVPLVLLIARFGWTLFGRGYSIVVPWSWLILTVALTLAVLIGVLELTAGWALRRAGRRRGS